MSHDRRFRAGFPVCAALLVAAGASLAPAAVQRPNLGAARGFAVLAGSTVSSTGATAVVGDVGVSPGTGMTGFPPGTVTGGSIHTADLAADGAHRDASLAYAFLKGMASIPANELTDTDLGGRTLAPGVYRFASSAGLTGELVLDAGGRSDAVFVFQIGSGLTTAPGSSVVVIDGGADYDESNVYWQVGSSATIDSGTQFIGNILAYTGISMEAGATMTGNALALNGAVTMVSNGVTAAPNARDRPVRRLASGRSNLAPPEGALDGNARARIRAKHFPEGLRKVERSWLKLDVSRMQGSTGYTLWEDNPSTPEIDLVQIDSFTTRANGTFHYEKDTRRGDALPFGATLSNLSGVAVEVRDSAGTTTLLAGAFPTTSP